MFSRLFHTPVGAVAVSAPRVDRHRQSHSYPSRRIPPVRFFCKYLFLIIYHVFDPIMSLLDLMHERSMKAWRLFFSEHFAVEVL
jgi:hypothetical protein